MKISSIPTWLSDVKDQHIYPALNRNITVDVAIIGGGLTGISTAYQLAKAGKSVAVLEKGTYKDSTTAYTTAFITYVLDSSLTDLTKMFGEKKAKLLWQSGNEAIDEIEKIVKKEKIDCDFTRCDEYTIARNDSDKKSLQEEATLAQKLGFPLEWKAQNDLEFTNEGYLLIPRQAKFHPINYLQALKKACTTMGVQIYENTEVTQITSEEPLIVSTKNNTVTTDSVITATYNPFNHPLQLFGRKGMYTSYVIEARIPKNSLPIGLYLDTKNPYNYWRVDNEQTTDRLIIGGKDHRKEIPMNKEKNYHLLEKELQKLLPNKKYTITRQWDGGILEPSDGIACVGRYSRNKNLYVAMAFSGNGMTYATITSLLMTDMILEKRNKWENLYNPTRIPTFASLWQKGKDYSGEFFGGVVKNILLPQ